MGFNWESTESYWFVDQENKMLLVQNPSWKQDGDNGKGDAIGRSMLAYFVYGDKRFIEGIEACWEKVPNKGIRKLFKKYHYQGYRYPHRYSDEVGLSRDHTLNTILAYKMSGKSDEEIWEFVKHLRYRISDFAIFTPELWLFVRMCAGRRFATWIFPRVQFFVRKMTSWWQLKVQKKLGFGPHFEEDQDTFKHLQNDWKPKIIKHLALLLHPVYSLYQDAKQSTFIKNDKWRKKVQDQIYRITPTYNYVIKLLCDHSEGITEEMIMNYKSMEGGRWSGIMNIWWNDRGLKINKNEDELQCNVMDVDYLRKLWEIHEA